MGVPKFYRFVSERYPLINTKLHQHVAPAIDNLYLDMNGIMHNCARSTPGNGGLDTKRYSEAMPVAKSQDAIFLDVFKYIDNLVAMLPPTKLLYMAIDGVAPRAKMNQQRSRRFRSAKERVDEHNRRVEEDPMYAAAGVEPFDSNCITPGTHFMYNLTAVLKYYVAKKISEDSLWSNIQVVLSGAEVPGEGEHKIMEYIRSVRETGHMPPNTRHCVYGLDADLIMLGLVTHEPHFFLLREKVDFGAYWRKKGGPRIATSLDTAVFGEFELLSIGVLREYLMLELGADGNSKLPFFNVERVADDFVFILMLIGNDFLPNLPFLDIADGTLHVLLHLYKRLLPILGGYLTEEGKICPERLEYFLAKLGLLEKRVLRHRMESEESARNGRGGRRGAKNAAVANVDLDEMFGLKKLNGTIVHTVLSPEKLLEESRACRALAEDAELVDLKRRYYSQKLGMTSDNYRENELEALTHSYVQGIMWTLKYYTEGCQYWRWFYPYHYAPFASDITNLVMKIAAAEKGFVKGKPFRPFDQLVSVLPPASAWCLPKPFQWLMTNPSSSIADQFPSHFETDMNGKRNDWEAVVLLPFVDEGRLLKAIDDIPDKNLTQTEIHRNQHGSAHVYSVDESGEEEMFQSPFGSRMPSFMNRTKCRVLVLPKLQPGHPFKARILSGTQKPNRRSDLADLPSLNYFPHRSRLDRAGINIFGSPSRSESIILMIDFKDDKLGKENGGDTGHKENIAELEKRGVAVNSTVWFGYPWRKAGHVNRICDESQTKSGDTGRDQALQKQNIRTKSTEKGAYNSERGIILSDLLSRKGIEISSPSAFISVKAWDDKQTSKEEDAMGSHVSQFVHSRQSTNVTQETKQAISKGQNVMYIGHGVHYGHVAKVMSRSNDTVRIQFDTPTAAAREPAFGYRVVSLAGTQRWTSLRGLAHNINLGIPVVDAFLGSVRVRMTSSKDELDVGLGIKYVSRGLCIPGYARKDERDMFLFSEKSANLLVRYHAAFPDLFRSVEKRLEDPANRRQPIHTSKELFGKSKKSDEAAKAACTWISVQDIAGLPLVSADATVLSKETIAELERHREISKALQKEYRSSVGKGDSKEVHIDQLLTGSDLNPKLVNSGPMRPGDRIANIRSDSKRLGLRGTVVGVHGWKGNAKIEVVFDEAFFGGGELNGRCADGRGKAVEVSSVVILRPERDNEFYVRHYARVAAQIGAKGRTAGKDERTAVSVAAVASYAQAVRGERGVQERMSGKGSCVRKGNADSGGETVAPKVVLPLPSFAARRTGRESGRRGGVVADDKLEREKEADKLSEMLKKELGIVRNGVAREDLQATEDRTGESEFDAMWKSLETQCLLHEA